jgi:hypothetical protein
MKYILTLLFCCALLETNAQRTPFIRVYNLEGHKFLKGRLQKTSDSGLVVSVKGLETMEVGYHDIEKIRLRRSAGLTALIAGGIPAMWGISLIKRNQDWEGLIGVLLVMEGMAIAPIAGGIKALLNPRPIRVNGELVNWEKAKRLLDQKLK